MALAKSISPFVKWAGGKGQLLERLKDRTPNDFDTYFEPFIGGGALLFELKPQKAVIGDINEQLINVYKQLQIEPRNVIKAIKKIESIPCNKEYYYQIREEYNTRISNGILDSNTAGMMIWINKHCFNGLYRVNGKGLFNVPYNNNDMAKSMDEVNLVNIGYYLANSKIDIRCQDFENICKEVKKGDFVYFDSPYVPISETANFTDYTKDGFSYEDHERLAELFKRLDGVGAKVMLSNHNVPLVHELYAGYDIEPIDVRRNINSDAKKRTGKEVIITNYHTGFLSR